MRSLKRRVHPILLDCIIPGENLDICFIQSIETESIQKSISENSWLSILNFKIDLLLNNSYFKVKIAECNLIEIDVQAVLVALSACAYMQFCVNLLNFV
jgi:hypothetical protein